MSKVDELLKELGWDEDKLVKIVYRYLKWEENRRKAQRKFYTKNKKKLDNYHAKYRKDRPVYRRKAIERSKKRRRKI